MNVAELKRQIKVKLDERRREFLLDMLDTAEPVHKHTDEELLAMPLDDLENLYADDEVYDYIWMGGSLSDDNNRHEADDIAEGFEEGVQFVLRLLEDEEVVAQTQDPF